ncbi:GGDEF domain-containing response regulator [Deinococcus maricopensis]|uniref:Response regulator receiver modulated diguanylate cyclase n=1 Tax=Deinococcus maricopensis (strain DSM 21211 / LMG 22137 / NRRL B-23946 / LB-34) TaxID=709986 RepID=E8U369_DEIML|nr:diguanylate cyclase [Deinococcus maricopensis]ADV66014.1 response regulator receiver modulated diguanylate cyclase [Deinococcus maricopensis DSM 21211]
MLVVDDDDVLRQTIVRLLEGNGHTVLSAENGQTAVDLCRQHDVHLMLLDYFMPGMTGQDVVREVRTFNQKLQIVLQTGYASERPPRDMLRELDIQGYHDKSEGPDKLLVWVDAALKTYRHVNALHASRDGLSYILKVTPELHRLQPLEDLLRGILLQLQGILGFTSAWLATIPEHEPVGKGSGFVATPDQKDFRIRIATGRFERSHWHALTDDERSAVLDAAASGQPTLAPFTALPLRVGERMIGVVLLDLTPDPSPDLHLLEIFATQAAVAIENVRLYELATIDDLTGLANKRSWLTRLDDALALARRYGHPTSVLIVDIDHFKRVNDTYGHLAGDELLRALGQELRAQARASDLIGRYGGEELVALLPHTDSAGALVMAERLRAAVHNTHLTWQGEAIRVTASIGLATLIPMPGGPPHGDAASDLLGRADLALYEAKRGGRNRTVVAPATAPVAQEAPDAP